MSAFWKDPEINLPGAKRRGRPKGPAKVRLQAWVLPETLDDLRKRAFAKDFNLGTFLDWLLGRKKRP
jgi:hypothetical protein